MLGDKEARGCVWGLWEKLAANRKKGTETGAAVGQKRKGDPLGWGGTGELYGRTPGEKGGFWSVSDAGAQKHG